MVLGRYIATTSDHHAHLLRLELTGVALLLQVIPTDANSSSLYWKLNVVVLRDPFFVPVFQEAWEPMVAELPLDLLVAAAWW